MSFFCGRRVPIRTRVTVYVENVSTKTSNTEPFHTARSYLFFRLVNTPRASCVSDMKMDAKETFFTKHHGSFL